MNLNHFVSLSDIIVCYNISNFNLYMTSRRETWKTLFLKGIFSIRNPWSQLALQASVTLGCYHLCPHEDALHPRVLLCEWISCHSLECSPTSLGVLPKDVLSPKHWKDLWTSIPGNILETLLSLCFSVPSFYSTGHSF